MNYSMIAAEGDLKSLKLIAEYIVKRCACTIVSEPSPAMVMVKHIDPLEKTPFYIGEAFVTQCEVEIDGNLGYGCIIGNNLERALYMALMDSLFGGKHFLWGEIAEMLAVEEKNLKRRWAEEYARVSKTKVIFNDKR